MLRLAARSGSLTLLPPLLLSRFSFFLSARFFFPLVLLSPPPLLFACRISSNALWLTPHPAHSGPVSAPFSSLLPILYIAFLSIPFQPFPLHFARVSNFVERVAALFLSRTDLQRLRGAIKKSFPRRLPREALLIFLFVQAVLLHAALYIGRVQQMMRLFAAGGAEKLLIKCAADLALL